MKIVGKVLWWDARDQNGIIKDSDGRKFYFDVSVIDSKSASKVKAGAVVRFEFNSEIKDALCARKVSIANNQEKSKLEKYESSRRQLSLFQ
jgi:cold shock CspA family protein